MTDAVLVDTNIILDVTGADPHWLDWSRDQMCQYQGRLWINPLIYAELCYQAETIDAVDSIVAMLGLQYVDLPKEALFWAAKSFQLYRQRGGTKSAPLADFFIGAHAQAVGCHLLTRDPSRYRSYFPHVPLICP
jgi:predicted nucleic acid-binding protein